MAQSFIVSKAFQSKNKDTGEPDVISTKGGDMHKYLVQVENQPIEGWISILKKPGNEVKEGDELYGDVVENQWGKPQFNRSQKPDGYVSQAPRNQQPSGDLEDKIDYIITLLEGLADKQGAEAPTAVSDKPVDLSALDY